jgi:hypothetical protein
VSNFVCIGEATDGGLQNFAKTYGTMHCTRVPRELRLQENTPCHFSAILKFEKRVNLKNLSYEGNKHGFCFLGNYMQVKK